MTRSIVISSHFWVYLLKFCTRDRWVLLKSGRLSFRSLNGQIYTHCRSEKVYYHTGSFTLQVVSGAVEKTTGPYAMRENSRSEDQKRLLRRFVSMLPDINITVWVHDTPVMHIAAELKCVTVAPTMATLMISIFRLQLNSLAQKGSRKSVY